MDNKLLVFIFGLFIIYFLCKNNVMKGGKKANIIPGDIEGKYERINPTPGNSYHYITFSRKGKGFVWTLKSNFGWYVDENLIPVGDNYAYKNADWAGKKINIKKNENNEVIGLTSSEGEYFNRVGDLKNSAEKMKELKKYSEKELEMALKKIKLVDATIIAKDLLGDEIFKGQISRDVYLDPGRADNVEGSYDDYMINKCGRIKSVEFPDIKYVLDVSKIAFEDNTVLEFN